MSIWQSKSWGKFLVSSGQAEEIFDVSGIQVEKRKVALWEYGLFALGVKDSPNPFIKGELEQLCKQQNCLFVQVEILDYNLVPPLPLGEEIQRWGWSKNYYKKFITPYTALIDLNKSEDEILTAMKPKGRYNIKLARKKWVEISWLDGYDDAGIESFYKLMKQTTTRDSFSGNTQKYYEQFLLENKTSQLLLAKIDGVVVAGGIFIFEKEVSIYYYGASTSDTQYRNSMAPYLLQWEAITKAKSYWSKLYDFLGVASPDEANSSLAGVTSFKKKLTPDIRQVSQATIYVNKKMKYSLIQILRKITK